MGFTSKKHGAKRASWTQSKKSKCRRAGVDAAEGDVATDEHQLQIIASDAELINKVWHSDYATEFYSQIASEPELADSMLGFVQSKSEGYARRLKGEKADAYLKRISFKIHLAITILLKAQNSHSRNFWLTVRSLSAFRQQLPQKWWKTEAKQGLLLSYTTTLKVLNLMSDNQPLPSYPVSSEIVMFCVDQCHLWEGCSDVTRNHGQETVDAEGNYMGVTQATVINGLQFHVDASLFCFTAEEKQHIEDERSLYEKPFQIIIPYFNYEDNKQNLSHVWKAEMELFFAKPDVTVMDAALSLVSRPDYLTPATEVKYLPAIPRYVFLGCLLQSASNIVKLLVVVTQRVLLITSA